MNWMLYNGEVDNGEMDGRKVWDLHLLVLSTTEILLVNNTRVMNVIISSHLTARSLLATSNVGLDRSPKL